MRHFYADVHTLYEEVSDEDLSDHESRNDAIDRERA